PTVVRAVHAAVVLLEQHLGARWVSGELVDTLPGLGMLVGHEPRPDALVLGHPGGAAIAGMERADGRDAHPQPVRVDRMRHDGMEDEASVARLPPLGR